MSAESLWYSMFVNGDAPTCKRYCRMPMHEQWTLVIDLAIGFAKGHTCYRNTSISRTHERYWYFPHELSATGWWMIPDRIERRVMLLFEDATRQVVRQNGTAFSWQIAATLQRWKRTGVWRRHVCTLIPRTPKPMKKGRKAKRET